MSNFIRVRVNDTGHELSIREERFTEDAYTRLDKPAYGPDGVPLPPKHRVSRPAPGASKSGQKAEPKKEND